MDVRDQILEDIARELGCEQDNEAILMAIYKLREAVKSLAYFAPLVRSEDPDGNGLQVVLSCGQIRNAVALIERVALQ